MRSSGWHIAGWLLCIALGAAFVQRAHADEPLRVVVRIASEADRALVPRLRGQLSDISAQLIVTETEPLEAAVSKQLEVARTLAKLQAADAVVWCASEPAVQQRRLYIELARSDRVLSRALLGAASAVLSSSDLETAAVLVRGALVALAQNVELGVSAEAVAVSGGDSPAHGGSAVASETDVLAAVGGGGDRTGDVAGGAVAELAPGAAVERGGGAGLAAATAMLRDNPPGPGDKSTPQPWAANVFAVPATGADAAEPNARARVTSAGSSDRGHELLFAESPLPGASPSATPVDEVNSALPRAEASKLARAALHARLTLGAQLALDGRSIAGQHGLSARAGVGFGAWALDVYGVLSMPSTIADPYFALNIARHAVGVALERAMPLSDALSLGAALHAGALLLRRTSRAQNPAAESMPASLTAALAFGPELALSWLPSRFGVSLRFGIDILPAAPRFEIARAAVSHSLWNIEPRMTLGWETALP